MENSSVYFKSLELENIKCFKGKHTIDFANEKGEMYQWNVIIGNNNTGKTTILRALAGIYPIEIYNPNKNAPTRFKSIIFANEKIRNKIILEGYTKQNKKQKIRIHNYNNLSYSFEIPFRFDLPNNYTEGGRRIYSCEHLYAYGTNRKASETSLSENKEEHNNIISLFDDKIDLINCEEWLLQLDYKQKSGQKKAAEILEKIKKVVLPSGIFPDITDFKFHADSEIYVLFKTDYGWVRFKDLGYGYQASMAWLFDFMKKMFDKYPDSENPLQEAAVVLIDELDLHLHPEWQRKIIGFLSNLFPKVQFIVTAHSPLILQSADEINLVMLKKQGDGVVIEQPKIPTFKGWTVEEILSELMELGEKTHSDDYLRLMADFDEALDEENYEQAQKAFEELKKILHENSEQRTLLKVQMRMLSYD